MIKIIIHHIPKNKPLSFPLKESTIKLTGYKMDKPEFDMRVLEWQYNNPDRVIIDQDKIEIAPHEECLEDMSDVIQREG